MVAECADERPDCVEPCDGACHCYPDAGPDACEVPGMNTLCPYSSGCSARTDFESRPNSGERPLCGVPGCEPVGRPGEMGVKFRYADLRGDSEAAGDFVAD